MYAFWYNYGENTKLFYMNADRFIVHVKTDHIYKIIAGDVETMFNTSNFELQRALPKCKSKK